METSPYWQLSHRADPRAKRLADRHYNRQKPHSPQFVPPGSCLVLLTPDADAVWVTSAPIADYVQHAWAGAWTCTMFRREPECPHLASNLIRSAVACTLWKYGTPPRKDSSPSSTDKKPTPNATPATATSKPDGNQSEKPKAASTPSA